jgi:hypothetical protein
VLPGSPFSAGAPRASSDCIESGKTMTGFFILACMFISYVTRDEFHSSSL